MPKLQKVLLAVFVFVLVVTVGLGIYYFATRESEVPTRPILQPSPTEIFSTPTPYLPPDVPPDAKIIEGTITQLEAGKVTVTANGQNFDFFLDEEKYSSFVDPDKGVVVGAKLKVYYKKEGSKLNFFSVMILE